jgi:hypothetical protein
MVAAAIRGGSARYVLVYLLTTSSLTSTVFGVIDVNLRQTPSGENMIKALLISTTHISHTHLRSLFFFPRIDIFS